MKIGLIGTAPASVRLAPYESPDWEIWGCSPGAYPVARNPKVWFELHRYEPGQEWFSPEYCKFLHDFEGTVYVAEEVPQIPNGKVLPVDYLINKYSPYFFTSSLAWMMAMAIEESPETIGLWGVDMSAGEEYGHQRQGCQYFALLARAMGIEVGVPPESDLLRPAPLYGVCEVQHGWIKQTARARELGTRVLDAQQRMDKAKEELLFLQGAKDDQEYQLQNWFGVHDSVYVEPPHVPILENLKLPEPIKFDENAKPIR